MLPLRIQLIKSFKYRTSRSPRKLPSHRTALTQPFHSPAVRRAGSDGDGRRVAGRDRRGGQHPPADSSPVGARPQEAAVPPAAPYPRQAQEPAEARGRVAGSRAHGGRASGRAAGGPQATPAAHGHLRRRHGARARQDAGEPVAPAT